MQKASPLISILIATKNRIPFCISSIESILKNHESDFELIIQDNSDSRELGEYINNHIFDVRLIYHYTPPPFSSIDNFNAALDIANGEYVCLIGDDDGINPHFFQVVKWAKQNNIKAIVPSLNAIYWWPDACRLIENKKKYNGLLQISKITAEVNESYSAKEVTKLIKHGGQNYLRYRLPKLYHGIIKKECLNSIKNYTGKYIGGLSPDIYLSVALTEFVDKVIQIDYPLTIAGICHLSTSADSGSGKHSGKLENAPHLRDRGHYLWSEQVPQFYSVETIWADSAIAALRDLKKFELMGSFNITTLTVSCLQNHKEYSSLILQNYFDNKASSHLLRIYLLIQLKIKKLDLRFTNITERLLRKLKNIVTSIFKIKGEVVVSEVSYNNIQNIYQATNELSKYLSQESLSIELVIKRLDSIVSKRAE